MILFYTLMMLYALAFCAVCRQCHQLKVRHTFMLSVIMLVVGVLLYQWLPHHKILVSLTDATLFIMLLEWITIGLGLCISLVTYAPKSARIHNVQCYGIARPMS